ncbi:MAG: hypothetical protein ACRDUY_09125 [Nitriliruptorales bacterium]
MPLRAVPRAGRQSAAEDGFLTVQFLAAVGLSLVLLTTIANLVLFQYGRGVVRAAVDEGARRSSRVAVPVEECERRANEVVRDLLGGAMGAGVDLRCVEAGDVVVAEAAVTFDGWAPLVPDWSFSVRGTALKERAP